jgi:hypothetical protein
MTNANYDHSTLVDVNNSQNDQSTLVDKYMSIIHNKNVRKIPFTSTCRAFISARNLYIHIYTYMICIINFKNTLFKGFTRGGPCVPSLMKQNLNRTQKYKVIGFKKIKRTF